MSVVRDEWMYVMNECSADEWVMYVMLYCENFQFILTWSIVFLGETCTVPVDKKTSGPNQPSCTEKKKEI